MAESLCINPPPFEIVILKGIPSSLSALEDYTNIVTLKSQFIYFYKRGWSTKFGFSTNALGRIETNHPNLCFAKKHHFQLK